MNSMDFGPRCTQGLRPGCPPSLSGSRLPFPLHAGSSRDGGKVATRGLRHISFLSTIPVNREFLSQVPWRGVPRSTLLPPRWAACARRRDRAVACRWSARSPPHTCRGVPHPPGRVDRGWVSSRSRTKVLRPEGRGRWAGISHSGLRGRRSHRRDIQWTNGPRGTAGGRRQRGLPAHSRFPPSPPPSPPHTRRVPPGDQDRALELPRHRPRCGQASPRVPVSNFQSTERKSRGRSPPPGTGLH